METLERYLHVPDFAKSAVVRCIKDNRKINPFLLYYRYVSGKDTDKRREVLKEIIDRTTTTNLSILLERQRADLEQWEDRFGKDTIFQKQLVLTERMIVGMGHPSSFENGLLLHWIHGIPYINGEALKGAARSFAFETLDKNADSQREMFIKIFGTFEKQEDNKENVFKGKVTFFDALPEQTESLFDIDIVTCHYGEYYTPKSIDNPPMPGDWYKPVPVPFLTVKKGVKFEFTVASKENHLVQKAGEWLKNALITRGMGAKKRIGYGHFLEVT